MRTVIFDLDGTLADTSGDLIAAANACFRDLGLGDVLDAQADAGTAFRGGRAMLEEGFRRTGGFGAAEVERQYPRLLDAYRDEIDRRTTLYPGAMAAVDRLRAAGHATGICTNKPTDLAEMLLGRLGVRDAFASVVGAGSLPQRKPHPAPLLEAVRRAGGDPGHACLIGDTVTDRETGRAAAIPVVLVTFGPEGRAVAELEPDALLDHFDGLDEIVAALAP